MSMRSTFLTTRLLLATLSIVLVSVCSTGPAGAAAQSTIKTIDKEVAQLNSRLTASYGKLGGKYQSLESRVDGIQAAATADAKAQNGKLTPAQTAAFIQRLSLVSQSITDAQSLGAPSGTWMSNHPAAAKVLNGAEAINAELTKDHGSLGGNYTSLELQDNSIRATAKNLAVEQNGLSAAQVKKFDSELTALQNEINADFQQ